MKYLLFLTVSTMGIGCSSVVDSMIDSTVSSVFETDEEKQVRQDTERYREEKPLKYHNDGNDLKRHRQDLRFEAWERDRDRAKRKEQADHHRRMKEDQQLYEKIQDIPLDDIVPPISPMPE